MRVGILKPDHLGDLILAAPAIAALQRRFAGLILFCYPKNLGLAAHLFPALRAVPILLPHLDKERRPDRQLQQRLELLRKEVDLLICLRWDHDCQRLLTIPDIEYHVPGAEVEERHVAAQHRDLVEPFTGSYDILSSYVYPDCPPVSHRPRELSAVALCISAGFHLNAWPLNHWLGLARLLHRDGIEIVLLGGPDETAKLHVLGRAIRDALGYSAQTIAGGKDFRATLCALGDMVDLVVATDSGSAHLAALARPVISLFGGSPWRRFAPLGRHNAILCRRVSCSPCIQFYRLSANTCHTQECLSNLKPGQVLACLRAYLADIDLSTDRLVEGVFMSQSPWEEKTSGAAA
jgi:ADP-heptose:LPS heptosyltransferase